jgi:hypothetical protein
VHIGAATAAIRSVKSLPDIAAGRKSSPVNGPYVGSVLEGIAASYDHEAKWNDSDAKIRSRMPY